MSKATTIFYYGVDGEAAKARAAAVRKDNGNAQVRHAVAFNGEIEPCTRVVLLDVSTVDVERIKAAYADSDAEVISATPQSVLPPPPPPPPPGNPLDDLPAKWRLLDPIRLRELAASVSGRTVENKDQAIAVIEQALAARK